MRYGLFALAIGLPGLALADPGDGSGYGHGHMWGYDGWGMVFGPLIMLVWIGVLIAAVVLLVRWLGGGDLRSGPTTQDNALSVLKARYAKGEIDTAEFEERKAALGG